MSYAIITVGGKQYRVQEGERLLVDRLAADEGNTFTPRVQRVGGFLRSFCTRTHGDDDPLRIRGAHVLE